MWGFVQWCVMEQLDSGALCSGAAGQWGCAVEQMDSVGLCAMEQMDFLCGAVCNGAAGLDGRAPRLFGAVCNGADGQWGFVQWSSWWSKHKKYVNVLINTCRTCRLVLRIICIGLRKALTVSLCMLLHDTSYAGCTAVPCTMPCLPSPPSLPQFM